MSNETQWTPGPWEVTSGVDSQFVLGDFQHFTHGLELCRVGGNSAEFIANARLIAAAPEMAELLAELTLDLTVPIMARGKCALLLAKIKGTTHA